MNKYGKFAQETWKMTAPSQYALIPDPEEWFRKLGEEAMHQVGELQYQIAGPDPEDETYLEKVGRLNNSRMRAEEIVRAEMLTPDEMETEGDEEDEEDESVMSAVHEYLQTVETLRRELAEGTALEEAEYQRQQDNQQR